MKNIILLFCFTVTTFISFNAFSQPSTQQISPELSEAELAQMLAPIALYPDSLLTHILISSTYPIEVIEAHRWLKKNDKLNSTQIAQSIESFDWDASVKALVPFEQVLSRLSEDLSWMQQLGDAFLQDEEKVLESIQLLREQAKLAGNLGKMDNMEVSYEGNNIIIEPAVKEVVYVPYYDTRMVYGAWYWSSYPPVYWRPHRRVYVNHYNPFYWHSGIHISFNYFFSTFHWHKRHVVVVNPYKSHYYRSRSTISRGGYAKRWAHQPTHRRGVAYKSQVTRQKYYRSGIKTHKANKSKYVTHGRVKQRLSSTNHHSRKKVLKKTQVHNKKSLQSKLKSNSIYTQHKATKQSKRYSSNLNVPKVALKQHKEKVHRQKNSEVTKSKKNSSRSRYTSDKQQRPKNKQQRQYASLKTNRSSQKKVRN